ncbi:N-acetylmannosamine-6-phosphate 2-epimerase [Kribbella sp. VKM Ac-2566]|uniref:N-acetylmannosamine-6-phosphate 2-epimerase n=1 Tax=Kribbella sp. VKM Ac-2566 TaxID=2512218 RepID=UPI0010628B97|nr:N-acetylmannosamine-6-phosphate 2-epimerase [Kribbella sp. VKM Ac-2566]TDW91638.1 N-acylglucosamine-6-phosphate 2-epimerase [Kribbella sp. VKM Ac-2566]
MTINAVNDVLERIRGGLVVSCQARGSDPLRDSRVIAAVSASTVQGGAVGLRLEGPADIRAVRPLVDVPIIGLWKVDLEPSDVYITPTVQHAEEVVAAGATIVALDGTARPRPDGNPLIRSIEAIHEAGALVMADVSTLAEGEAAEALGADVVSTTLSGYTPDSPQVEAPDLTLVGELARRVQIPVVAEGRYRTPFQATQALSAGAWAVVVGTAITAPGWITSQFVRRLQQVEDQS